MQGTKIAATFFVPVTEKPCKNRKVFSGAVVVVTDKKIRMRNTVIQSNLHGYLDYTYAPLVWAAPKIFRFENSRKATTLCKIVSGATVGYSLLTNYKLGAVKLVPYKTHAAIDLAAGVFNVAAPWLLGVQKNKSARNTLLVMGVTGIVVGVLSLLRNNKVPKKLTVNNEHWG